LILILPRNPFDSDLIRLPLYGKPPGFSHDKIAMLCYTRIFVGQRVLNVTYDVSTIKLDLESNKQKL